MPWNNGGPNQGPSPWGSGGSGNEGPSQPPPGGPQPGGPNRGRPPSGPPDLDQLIAQVQAFIRNAMGDGGGNGRGPNGPGGPGFLGGFFNSGRGLSILAMAVVALWVASGVYRIQPDEQGVVLRFGAYSTWTPPGLHWHLPWPIETVEKPAVTRIN
ncbi:MAG: protease modulator HflK, partial [Rhodospirillales bacterium]